MPITVVWDSFVATVTYTCDVCGTQQVRTEDGREVVGDETQPADRWTCDRCRCSAAIHESAPPNLARLGDADRRSLAKALGALGHSQPTEAAQALRGLADDPEAGVRLEAIRSLVALGGQPPPEETQWRVGVLRGAWRASPADAATLLASVGPTGVTAAAELVDELPARSKVMLIRKAAEAAAWDNTLLAFVRRLTHDESLEVRREAVEALGDIGVSEEADLDRLERLLSAPNPTDRASAATALGKMRPRPAGAVVRLKALMADESKLVRVAAAFALFRIGELAWDQLEAIRGAPDSEPGAADVTSNVKSRHR